MKWSTLNKIYTGVIGNSMFAISIAIILSYMPILNLSSSGMTLSILGALIVATSFVINKSCIPDTISSFIDPVAYFDHLCRLRTANALSYEHEFKPLENNESTSKLPIFSSAEFNLPHFNGIDNYKTIMADGALYPLSIIKYDYVNHSKPKTRRYLAISFVIGVALLYSPSAYRVIDFAIDGVTAP
jgi:hypothetical protein